ncbi:MAG: hypothetical protein EOO85_22465 [Pedobacter sp.]|nr:MAG: hypothetical protein EOO85_22465 [Pedobacter sp.]
MSKIEKEHTKISYLMPKLLDKWYWFIISAVAFVSLSYLYLKYQTPVFKTTAKVLINNEKSGSASSSELQELGGLINNSRNIDDEMVILKTYFLMEKVVKELKANITYFQEGTLKPVELYEPPFIFNILQSQEKISSGIFKIGFKGNKIVFEHGDKERQIKFYEPFEIEGIGKVQIERRPDQPVLDESYMVNVSSIEAKANSFVNSLSVMLTNNKVNILLQATYSMSCIYQFFPWQPAIWSQTLSKITTSFSSEELVQVSIWAKSSCATLELMTPLQIVIGSYQKAWR